MGSLFSLWWRIWYCEFPFDFHAFVKITKVTSSQTVSVISTFILAMVLYPDVLRRAQTEIDAVVGTERLPTFTDRPNLPYVNAILKESLRWNVVTPTGILYSLPYMNSSTWLAICRCTACCFWGRHMLWILYSKGCYYYSECMVWGIYFRIIWTSDLTPYSRLFTHNPKVYPDPWKFKPERFLSENGHVPELDPHTIAFGFGRRYATVFLWVSLSLVSPLTNSLQQNLSRQRTCRRFRVHCACHVYSSIQYQQSEGCKRERYWTIVWIHVGHNKVSQIVHNFLYWIRH